MIVQQLIQEDVNSDTSCDDNFDFGLAKFVVLCRRACRLSVERHFMRNDTVLVELTGSECLCSTLTDVKNDSFGSKLKDR